jgi:hypothetical protein
VAKTLKIATRGKKLEHDWIETRFGVCEAILTFRRNSHNFFEDTSTNN